jgi:hypothetical protein
MIIRDLALLHPKMEGPARRLNEYLIDSHQTHRTEFGFEVYETLRSGADQLSAFKKGVSKARPWQGPHMFGLAVDFVPYLSISDAAIVSKRINKPVGAGWCWDIGDAHTDWTYLRVAAEKFGLVSGSTFTTIVDRPHVEHPIFPKLRQLLA